jgi:predicted DNA-binding transcriptional regulator AlpA
MPDLNTIEPLVDVKEAAVVLGITPRALRDKRYDGRDGPPHYHLAKNVVRYKMSEVIEWRESCRDAGGEL